MGVYALTKPDVWVYVGSGDIRKSLLGHLNGDNPCINREQPTHWTAELRTDADCSAKAAILELSPICNQRVG